jgi:hypothetical protein
VLIPLYTQMRPAGKPAAKAAGSGGKSDAKKEKEKAKVGDEEAVKLIDDNKAFAAAFATEFGGGK